MIPTKTKLKGLYGNASISIILVISKTVDFELYKINGTICTNPNKNAIRGLNTAGTVNRSRIVLNVKTFYYLIVSLTLSYFII